MKVFNVDYNTIEYTVENESHLLELTYGGSIFGMTTFNTRSLNTVGFILSFFGLNTLNFKNNQIRIVP
jgi:hypothetical protein